jgi:ABC-type hemin transport system ATPase subunit
MSAPEAPIRVTGLRKTYGTREAVDGIDLQIERGEVFALLGPNGAGKTTTVEILEGFRKRDGGTVRGRGLRRWTGTRGCCPAAPHRAVDASTLDPFRCRCRPAGSTGRGGHGVRPRAW